MKNQLTTKIYFTLLFFIGSLSYAQVIDSGSTLAQFDVSASGGASYTIPISTPQGIRAIDPNVSLNYSSSTSNGIAGWGWNIGGLSTISRIPSTLHHDDNLDGVDFDNSDRFALDGQRLLLKSGTYGANTSHYETEKHSNVKIIAYGTSSYGAQYGPRYFNVIYPDGSRAWYGNARNSEGRLEWAIWKKQDAQNNYIEYYYNIDNGLRSVDKIKFGSRLGVNPPIEIKFYYKNRQRPEVNYIGGIEFKRTKVLDRLTVVGNGSLFREYRLTHHVNEAGYETMSNIQEFNRSGHALKPIQFTYDDMTTENSWTNGSYNVSPGFNRDSNVALSGDFTGDGKLDYITYQTQYKNRFHLFDQDNTLNSNLFGELYYTNYFDEIFVSKTLTNNGRLLEQDGLTSINEEKVTVSSGPPFNLQQVVGQVTFHSFIKTVPSTGFESHDRVWNSPTYNTDVYCGQDTEDKLIGKQYVSGDFNGDGITDVLAIEEPYQSIDCEIVEIGDGDPNTTISDDPYIGGGDGTSCECKPRRYGPSGDGTKVTMIDLNRNLTDTQAINNIGNILRPSSYGIGNLLNKFYTADFNGDGKTDLFHVTTERIDIYEVNGATLNHLLTVNDSWITKDKPLVFGDYNGDQKIDILVPDQHNSEIWKYFYSTGLTYDILQTDIDIKYRKSTIVYQGSNNQYSYYRQVRYIPFDFNNDGKAGILEHYLRANVPELNSSSFDDQQFNAYETSALTSPLNQKFEFLGRKQYYNNNVSYGGASLIMENRGRSSNLGYSYFSNDKVFYNDFGFSNSNQTQIKSIENNGLTHYIEYSKLNDRNSSAYTTDFSNVYPYININNIPLNLVSRVTETAAGMSRYKDFRYKGAVANVLGKGFSGFKHTAQSSIHGNSVSSKWTMTNYDVLNYGIPILTWTGEFPSASTFGYYSKTELNYDINISTIGVFSAYVEEEDIHDSISGIQATRTYNYDSYWNLTSSLYEYPDGTETVNITYLNNPSSLNHLYHIGRVNTKETINHLYGSDPILSFEDFDYNNNLVTQKKIRGAGTDWITENYTYDTFGNILSKTINAPGTSPRTESYTYDSSGRFMITNTDVEGKQTTTHYNIATGTVRQVDDNAFNTSSYIYYDDWQRIIKEIDYLGKEITTSYINTTDFGSGTLKVITNYDQGADSVGYYNAFGWEEEMHRLSLNNQWIRTKYIYDELGRKIRYSEPYFGSAAQWNYSYFDIHGRLYQQNLYTGKQITTSYNGLSVTVDDGYITTIAVSDTAGNIKSKQDPGGTINFQYHSNGEMKRSEYQGNVITTEIDGFGRKIELNDPSAGTYTYTYNTIGELLEETSPRGATTYSYTASGRVETKEIVGDNTNIFTDYAYAPNTFLVDRVSSIDNFGGHSYDYSYDYDTYGRLENTLEDIDGNSFEEILTYDSHGRISKTEQISSIENGANHFIVLRNRYEGNSGMLVEMFDDQTNKSLWKLNSMNERGQITNIGTVNNFIKTRSFDQYGMLNEIKDSYSNQGNEIKAVHMGYSFDAAKGVLNSRANNIFQGNQFSYYETFTHDNQNRLTDVNINGNVQQNQVYDPKGRITNNSLMGDYSYYTNNQYRLEEIDLNTQGDIYSQKLPTQQITYNSFKKAVDIDIFEEQQTNQTAAINRISFAYGSEGNRTISYYGGNEENQEERRYKKIYSQILPVEAVIDNETGDTKIIHYVGGNAYSATAASIQIGGESQYYTIHRDYLSSILAITDEESRIVEQNHIGAWGSVDRHLENGLAVDFNEESLLGRAFTSHEHLFGTGLIHMNGRMYDPQVRRFLSPDNYVQDPYSTQNYNRYGYVMNNPLSMNDPSGEIAWAAVGVAALIGSIVGAATYSLNALQTGDWSLRGFGLSILGGAVTGALGGIAAPGMFPAVMTSSHFFGFVASGIITGLFPTFSIPIKQFSLNFSPSIAFGTGGFAIGIAGSLNYQSKEFSFSIAGTIGKPNSSIGAGLTIRNDRNELAVSVGGTYFGGKHSQFNWFFGVEKEGIVSFKTTNDSFVGGDKYRTAAFELSVYNYKVGWSLYTTVPPDSERFASVGKGLDKYSPIWGANGNSKIAESNGANRGTYSEGERIYSGFYIQFTHKDHTFRIGHDGRWSQDLFQNGIHRYLVPTPYFSTALGSSNNLFFQVFRNQNPWTLYPN